MKRILGLILLCFFCAQAQLQSLTVFDLIKDVEALNMAVTKAHPIQLNRAFENPLPRILDSLKAAESGEFNRIEYHYALRAILSELGCYHTNIYPPKLPSEEMSLPHFPYKLWTDGQSLYLMAPSNDDVQSEDMVYPIQVFAINAVPVNEFLPKLLNFKAADGHQKTTGIWYFNKYGSIITREFFHDTDEFRIQLRNEVINSKAQNRVYSYGYDLNTDVFLDSLIRSFGAIKTFDVKHLEKVAYANISTFAYSDGERVANTFIETLNKEEKHTLIIDLRDNGGGKANNANLLASHFTIQPITGSDIIPKHNSGNGIGFSWAKIGLRFWQMVNVHRRVKGPNKERIYSFEMEASDIQFKGKVYVIVDGKTGSTASQFAAIMKHQCGAIIVGEETGGGDGETNAGSYAKLKLPASDILIRFPLVRSTNDLGLAPKHGGVTPNLQALPSARSISDQKDKVLETVIQHIKLN